MEEPRNEMETIILFERNFHDLFEIVSFESSKFPDAVVLERSSRKKRRAEFEFMASSFIEHEHDPYKCDVIICWKNDLDKSIHFPVWELSTRTFEMVYVPEPMELEIFALKIENIMLKRLRRREEGLFATHWRTVRHSLSPEQVAEISAMKTSEIASRYGIDDRTARNWRKYAQAGK